MGQGVREIDDNVFFPNLEGSIPLPAYFDEFGELKSGLDVIGTGLFETTVGNSTYGGETGEYTTLGAALTAEKTLIKIVGGTLETAEITPPTNYHNVVVYGTKLDSSQDFFEINLDTYSISGPTINYYFKNVTIKFGDPTEVRVVKSAYNLVIDTCIIEATNTTTAGFLDENSPNSFYGEIKNSIIKCNNSGSLSIGTKVVDQTKTASNFLVKNTRVIGNVINPNFYIGTVTENLVFENAFTAIYLSYLHDNTDVSSISAGAIIIRARGKVKRLIATGEPVTISGDYIKDSRILDITINNSNTVVENCIITGTVNDEDSTRWRACDFSLLVATGNGDHDIVFEQCYFILGVEINGDRCKVVNCRVAANQKIQVDGDFNIVSNNHVGTTNGGTAFIDDNGTNNLISGNITEAGVDITGATSPIIPLGSNSKY